jgi:hypothetical protein
MKPVTRYTSNEFHDWQRRALPSGMVIQDIDSWAMTISRSYKPLALLELKRSNIPVREWSLDRREADRPNLASLLNLAKAAGLPLYVLYFLEGAPITDDTLFQVHRLDKATPEYRSLHAVMTAREFAASFPYPFPPPIVSPKVSDYANA